MEVHAPTFRALHAALSPRVVAVHLHHLAHIVLLHVAVQAVVRSEAVHLVAVLAVVHSAVAVLAVVDSAVAHIAVDLAVVVLAAVVPSAEVHTAVDTAVAATAAVAVAEWVDIGNSEHQFPDFSIRHLRNLAH